MQAKVINAMKQQVNLTQQRIDAASKEIEAICIKYNLSLRPIISVELVPNENIINNSEEANNQVEREEANSGNNSKEATG